MGNNVKWKFYGEVLTLEVEMVAEGSIFDAGAKYATGALLIVVIAFLKLSRLKRKQIQDKKIAIQAVVCRRHAFGI